MKCKKKRQFDESGLMKKREASINDVKIRNEDRKFTWKGSERPYDFEGLNENL